MRVLRMARAAAPWSRARHMRRALRPSHVCARARQAHGTGYGGTGFKFDTEEDAQRKASRKVLPPALLCASARGRAGGFVRWIDHVAEVMQ